MIYGRKADATRPEPGMFDLGPVFGPDMGPRLIREPWARATAPGHVGASWPHDPTALLREVP